MKEAYFKEKTTEFVLAATGESFRDWLEKDVRRRQAEGRRKGGLTAGRGRKKDSSTPNLEESFSRNDRESAAILAQQAGVSKSYIYAAKRVFRSASDLVEAIERGELKLYKAEKIARRREELAALEFVLREREWKQLGIIEEIN